MIFDYAKATKRFFNRILSEQNNCVLKQKIPKLIFDDPGKNNVSRYRINSDIASPKTENGRFVFLIYEKAKMFFKIHTKKIIN